MWDKVKVVLKEMIFRIVLDIIYKIFGKLKKPEEAKKGESEEPSSQPQVQTHVMPAMHTHNASIENLKFKGTIAKDFLFAACDTFFAKDLEIIDLSKSRLAHRDAIQVTPYNRDGYLAGHIHSLTIKNVKIQSQFSFLQGIFVGDGYIDQLYLDSVEVETASSHTITLTGVRTGMITNCKVNRPIKLLPLRILGGTDDGRAIWIMEDTKLKYDFIEIDIVSDVHDVRTLQRNGWNVYDVDSKAVLDAVDDKTLSFEQRRKNFLDEAVRRGARVKII